MYGHCKTICVLTMYDCKTILCLDISVYLVNPMLMNWNARRGFWWVNDKQTKV